MKQRSAGASRVVWLQAALSERRSPMNSDRDQLAKEIFADALEKADAAERAAYLTPGLR